MKKDMTSEQSLDAEIYKMSKRISVRMKLKKLIEGVREGMYPPRDTTLLESRISGYLEKENLQKETRYVLEQILKPITPIDIKIKSLLATKLNQAIAEEREQLRERVGNKWKLAKFMHDRYEKYAFIFGWDTQEKTKVPFEDLPEENKKTMLAVAQDILLTSLNKLIIK